MELCAQEWWTDLWLNEGFASWIEYPCLEQFLPEFQNWKQIFPNEYAPTLALDALKSSHPIEVLVSFALTIPICLLFASH